MKKKVAILQPNYIPWKGYFDMIRSVDEFILLDDVQYTDRDWRNRNQIKTVLGLLWLTIPVKTTGRDQKIREVKVADPSWRKKHFSTFLHNYRKATFFNQYADWLETLFLKNEFDSLAAIDHFFIVEINKILGITTPLTFSSEYKVEAKKEEKILEMCKRARASIYVSGPAAKSYLDVQKFQQEGITVKWMDYSGYPEYRQLFPPFVHTVSILDLILNEGPKAINYMKKMEFE